MVIRLQNLKLKKETLNTMIDDMIEMKQNSLHKETFRHMLISKRLKQINKSNSFEPKDLKNAIDRIKYKQESEYETAKALKSISKSLLKYEKELLEVFKRLR